MPKRHGTGPTSSPGSPTSTRRSHSTPAPRRRAARWRSPLPSSISHETSSGKRPSHWQQVGARYDEARARVALGLALRETGEIDAAEIQLQRALDAFERLTATFDVVRVTELLGRAAPQSRVVRTFMFTDIEDSTTLLATMGDDRWSGGSALARLDAAPAVRSVQRPGDQAARWGRRVLRRLCVGRSRARLRGRDPGGHGGRALTIDARRFGSASARTRRKRRAASMTTVAAASTKRLESRPSRVVVRSW